MQPRSHYITCGGFNIHYTAWGDPSATAVIAWHGLARSGRDFDTLAQHLSSRYHVICPDTIGRGLSQWSQHPKEDYCIANYARHALELMNGLHISKAHWIGTSMGGIIGMVCAANLALPEFKGRLQSLLLNDIAPKISSAAVERIKAYAGHPPAFDTVPELEAFFRQVYAPFGLSSDSEWQHLTETSVRRLPDGRVTPHYDPNLVQQFFRPEPEFDMWAQYDAIDLPVFVMRGAHSDLVAAETIEAMHTRGPGAKGVLRSEVIQGCGHAPALNTVAQIQSVVDFLHSCD